MAVESAEAFATALGFIGVAFAVAWAIRGMCGI